MKKIIVFYAVFFANGFLLRDNTGDIVKSTTVGTGGELKFKHFLYIDRQGTGIEVFSFLMPNGWQFEGTINRVTDNPNDNPNAGSDKNWQELEKK